MNSKGMEMAIQIFIVLFVLLAVAMIVLQLVSQQFSTNETQLKAQQTKSQNEMAFKQFKLDCESLCKSGVSSDMAKFCTKANDFRVSEGISQYDQQTFTTGIGVCDKKVYCALIADCGGRTYTMKECATLACSYWKKTTGNEASATTLLQQFVLPDAGSDDTCYNKASQPEHWFTLAFPTNGEVAGSKTDLNCTALLASP